MSDPPSTDPPCRPASVVAGVIVLLIFLTPIVGFVWLRGMSRAAVESNYLSHTRDMLIRHFAETLGEWPASWDDLADDFKPADAQYGTPSLETLKQVMSIDFSFDPASVVGDDLNANEPDDNESNLGEPTRVLWLTDREASPAVRSANVRLIDAIRKRHPHNERKRARVIRVTQCFIMGWVAGALRRKPPCENACNPGASASRSAPATLWVLLQSETLSHTARVIR